LARATKENRAARRWRPKRKKSVSKQQHHAAARHASRKGPQKRKKGPRRKGPGGVAFPRPFTIRKSTIQGRGAFAIRWIPAGTRIIEYLGERISSEEADTRYDDDTMGRHHTFLFAVDDDTVIDAGVRGNAARFINHSCEPNCEAVDYGGRIFIEALRDIAPGEELFYDYAYELDEPLTPALKRRYPCQCGAANCRGTILAVK
jgi:SET domain-containing protein